MLVSILEISLFEIRMSLNISGPSETSRIMGVLKHLVETNIYTILINTRAIAFDMTANIAQYPN
jgi:hypothetical protein